MNYETLAVETDARGVATLTLNRPEKHNAMSGQMIAELLAAAQALASDDHVRVVVLTGAGKSFCAGADLGWMQTQMASDPDTRAKEAGQLAYALQALNTLPKPLIGAIQGNAFGGGVGLASVCDIAIGASHLDPHRAAPTVAETSGIGSTATPLRWISKWQCSVVALPVRPARAMRSP